MAGLRKQLGPKHLVRFLFGHAFKSVTVSCIKLKVAITIPSKLIEHAGPASDLPENRGQEATPRLNMIAGQSVTMRLRWLRRQRERNFSCFVNLSGAYGAMVTRRSFASTCCPGVTSSFTRRPEMGAYILDCIFMASSVRSFAPRSTV